MHVYRALPDVSVVNDYAEIPGLGFLPVNAFVLHSEQPVVIDTGLGLPDRDFVSTISEVIDPKDVRWIWLTHPDRDHTGGIFSLLEAAPNARVVTTFAGFGIMSTERPLPINRVYWLNPGQSLDVGDRQLTGFRPPLFDNPATVGLLDSKTGSCFSSDFLGAPLSTAELASSESVDAVAADELRAGQLLWASVDSPWVQWVDRAKFEATLDSVREFAPTTVFSVHLPPVRGSVDPLLDTMREAPTVPNFVGPDQVALEAILASFEPGVPVTAGG